jgi:AcrR family transcriptional regulator
MALFNERGFAAVSVEDIAAAAGITKATLYYHYPSKTEIFVNSAVWRAAEIREAIDRVVAMNHLSVRERLALLLEARRQHTAAMAHKEAIMDEAMVHLSGEQQRRICNAFLVLREPFRDLIREGIERGELRPVDPDILATAVQLLFQPRTHFALQNKDPEMVDRELLALFYHGAAHSHQGY